MPANLIIPMLANEYQALIARTTVEVVAAKSDPLFVFNAAATSVEIHGEFRDLGTTELRRAFRNLMGDALRDPETAMQQYATDAYRQLTSTRRNQARAALANVAPPVNGPVAVPAHGVTGAMDAAQGGQHMLAGASGGMVLGYDHRDQPSKDFTTELIRKSGGTHLKHLFVEELASELQADIDAFLADPAAEMSTALVTRLNELQDSAFKADFEPMLHAAREKGVKVWGIDSVKADPLVGSDDPRYHERRLAVMNAEAKRVFDHVRQTYPNEPFVAMTGQAHVNTAEGGVPGLAQIMGVPGFTFDAETNRLAFVPEDVRKRAAITPLERQCNEAILKRARTDYKTFHDNYATTPAYTALPTPRPQLDSKLNLPEVTLAVQAVVKQFIADARLNLATDIAALETDPSVAAALRPIFQASIVRSDRREKLKTAIANGDVATVQAALNADPYLARMAADDTLKDTLLHAACEAAQPAVVQELIARGIDPNATDLRGRAPMHRALGERPGAAPAAADLAAVVGHLLTGQASPNLADPTGRSGLDLARTGPLAGSAVVEKFVAAGAAPATDLFVSKFVAAAEARYARVRQMGEADADVVEARQSAARLAGSLPRQGVPLTTGTEVDTAMTNGAVTAELDRLTAVWSARNRRKGETLEAIQAKDLPGLKALLDADPRLAHIDIHQERMALGLAAIHGNDAAMNELINARGVNVEQKSPRGRTALHEVLSQQTSKTDAVAQQRVTANARKLILRGADVNARNGRGETALHLAGFRNNTSMISELATLSGSADGPDPNARDARGWTPLDTVLAATNREAEDLLHQSNLGDTAPPLEPGTLSSVDILCQATLCEDAADTHKARKFIEKLYANAELRPMLDLAAAASCNPRNPPKGGLRLFASNSNTVGRLYGQTIGATAAYDEKVNTLLFPLADDPGDGKEGDAVGSLAHELTHLTAHLVTDNPATVPFTDSKERARYLSAINADVRKIQLLDDADPVQKFIKNRFSGRMDDYKDKPGTRMPKTGAEFDESLLQEFIVGVPQVAAVYGMDALQKHLPGLVDYYRKVWTPKVQATLANDPRFAAGRAKIDVAANQRAAQALQGHPKRQAKPVHGEMIKKDDARLTVDAMMGRIETCYQATCGQMRDRQDGRKIAYKPEEFELDEAAARDLEKKKRVLRAALTTALDAGNLPPQLELDDVRRLVEQATDAAATLSGSDLLTTLTNRLSNSLKDAKLRYVERRIAKQAKLQPRELAEAIVYRAEAMARAGSANADLDPDMEVKASKQRELVEQITASLTDRANAEKLKDPARLVDRMSAALSARADKAVYRKSKETGGHVSVNLKNAKQVWLAELATL